jgi:hypothetical protein
MILQISRKKICKFDNLVIIITIYLNKICEFADA